MIIEGESTDGEKDDDKKLSKEYHRVHTNTTHQPAKEKEQNRDIMAFRNRSTLFSVCTYPVLIPFMPNVRSKLASFSFLTLYRFVLFCSEFRLCIKARLINCVMYQYTQYTRHIQPTRLILFFFLIQSGKKAVVRTERRSNTRAYSGLYVLKIWNTYIAEWCESALVKWAQYCLHSSRTR